MKLSIITPYYKTLKETQRLAGMLEAQLNNQVEWIIVDDGCNELELDKLKAKVIHLDTNSGGASKPRNTGLDVAKGEYITFIDSDDIISDDYIEKILHKIETSEFDYCLFSWQFLNSGVKIIIKDLPPSTNCSIWNCIYKRDLIGNVRFDENLRFAEDYKFNQEVRKGKKENIIDILYFYNEGRVGSITTGD